MLTHRGVTDLGDDEMILDLGFVSLVLAAVAVAHGTYHSLHHNHHLDTSDAFLTLQPHLLATIHAITSEQSLLNLIFLKWSWACFVAAFVALNVITSPSASLHPRGGLIERRGLQLVFAVDAWYSCTEDFFNGPNLLARLAIASGAECGLHVSSSSFVPIPTSFCAAGKPVTRTAHPELFPLVFVLAPETESDLPFVPHLRGGHNASRHVVVLTLCVLFLADQLRQTRTRAPVYVRALVSALLVLWVFSLWATSVYLHSPSENISGFVIGVACFIFSQLPLCCDFFSIFGSS